MKSILVISRHRDVFLKVRSCFPEGYRVDQAADKKAALGSLRETAYGVLLVDMECLKTPPAVNGYRGALQPYWRVRPAVEIIVMAPHDQAAHGATAVRAGASHCLLHPLESRDVRGCVEKAFRSLILPSMAEDPLDRFWHSDSLETVRTRSPRMQDVYDRIRSVAPTRSTVLLTGETGTGKGVMARLIHRHSSRKNERLVSIHCGAIPDALVESELFGHEKGAFTGAVRQKPGKFEIARGGTVFLDEVGTISPGVQVKLLQVLHEGTFSRVGGEEVIQADVRVLAATNADLKSMSENGGFRKDLYYRLNVFPIEIPPLRERVEDIPCLVELSLRKLNRLDNKEIHDVDPRVMEALCSYSWPGNIRELENLIERAYILEGSSTLGPGGFPGELMKDGSGRHFVSLRDRTLAQVRKRCIEETEKTYIADLLSRHEGRVRASALSGGISTRQLNKLMKKYGITKDPFRRKNARRNP